MERLLWIDGTDRLRLAARVVPGRAPTVMFLAGFASDMTGSKAAHLADWCSARGIGFVRWDYAGCGMSEGVFTDGTIGRWCDNALSIIDQATAGPLILVGSSMGGWIGLLAALARPQRVIGFIGLAAAPDFSEALLWDAMTLLERDTLLGDGVLEVPSDYGAPLQITRRLVEEGRNHLMLGAVIPLTMPMRLIHGMMDPDVPWERSIVLADRISSSDIRVTLIKDAGHRLSRAQDLAILEQALEDLLSG